MFFYFRAHFRRYLLSWFWVYLKKRACTTVIDHFSLSNNFEMWDSRYFLRNFTFGFQVSQNFEAFLTALIFLTILKNGFYFCFKAHVSIFKKITSSLDEEILSFQWLETHKLLSLLWSRTLRLCSLERAWNSGRYLKLEQPLRARKKRYWMVWYTPATTILCNRTNLYVQRLNVVTSTPFEDLSFLLVRAFLFSKDLQRCSVF